MRIVPLAISGLVTLALVVALHVNIKTNPPIGKILSPSHGFWRNAEPDAADFSLEQVHTFLKNQVEVVLDDRLVPHIFAQTDADAYFVQGYLHARFRLWQMDFQTYAAAGRLCEILGEKSGNNSILELHDRKFRRMGMLYAAEKAVAYMNKQPEVKEAMEAYAAGVNHYISTLTPATYPLEYKVLNYAPEPWSPLKSALFLKYMSYDLSRDLDDFQATNLRNHLGDALYNLAFPIVSDSLDPIAPKGTKFTTSLQAPQAPNPYDSTLATPVLPATDAVFTREEDIRHPDVGSNNWVVGGSRTQSGRPILCNDPHLGLNLPSLWYEVQLHLPTYNTYGVSFPGAPGVVIGYNDSIAWGVTNARRDVMDFYEVVFKDSTMNEYLYNGQWVKTTWRTETIKVKGKADFVDKFALTEWGPVMYDANYSNESKNNKAYAVRWSAHDESAEVKTFMLLNRAKNYADYRAAIEYFKCPGQNFVFASKTNEIAWWQQAVFPAKWRRQGDFVMPGWDSTFAWKANIPSLDNIHMINPERGFVSSANQMPADTTYPFYLGGIHDVYRGIIINRYLAQTGGATAESMQAMQTDNYNVFAEMARPLLLKMTDRSALSGASAEMLNIFENWNLKADAQEKGQTIFTEWWDALADTIWLDDITRPDSLPVIYPQAHTLLEALLRDTAFGFVDNRLTPQKETLTQLVTAALHTAAARLKNEASLNWADFKATGVRHFLHSSLPMLSRQNLLMGGGRFIINATTGNHGPSWRMVVHMTDEVEAYGIYPGGQNGNPGSKYYDQFVNDWAAGRYNRIKKYTQLADAAADKGWRMVFKSGKG